MPATQSELTQLRSENARLRDENARLLCDFDLEKSKLASGINHLNLLLEMSARFSATLDLRKLLPAIMEEATRVVGAEASSLMLVEEATGDLTFAVALGERGEQVKELRVPRGQGVAGWVAAHGTALLVPDVEHEPRHRREIADLVGFHPRSIVCYPLMVGERVIGTIEVFNKLGAPDLAFHEDDMRDFAPFADRAAQAIAQASSFAQLQNANQRLLTEFERDKLDDERRIERLKLMFEVAVNIASTLNLKELLPKIMTDATRVMDAEASALMLIDEASGDLVFEVALGEKGEEIKAVHIKRGQGIAGAVAQSGRTELVVDAENDARVKKLSDLQMKSILCSPLLSENRVIGVVEVINKLDAPELAFSAEDIPVFEAFAAQAATAITQARAHMELAELFENTILVMSSTLDARDPYTQGHSIRVTDFGMAIAEELGIEGQELHDLRLAGLLHDVGKIGVPDAVLLKPGKLDDEEYDKMKKHPVTGYNIVRRIKQLKNSLPGIRNHHERIDGRGYPDGLKADEIPLQGRILAVADCFDAMTSNRAYRPGFDDERALKMIEDCKGAQHDARMVEALVAAYARGKIITQSKRSDYTAPQAVAKETAS